MISFYLKKLKSVGLESFWTYLNTPFTLTLLLNLFIISLSLFLSLSLRLGEDLSDIPLTTLILNTFLYLMFGTSALIIQHFYDGLFKAPILNKIDPVLILATYITLLYLPALNILPEDLSLPSSTPFINWFVLIALLHIPKLLKFFPLDSSDHKLASPHINTDHLNDFLQCAPLTSDTHLLKNLLKDKRILITGAEGALGSELIQQIIKGQPARLGLLDNNEYLLHLADLEIQESTPSLNRETFLGDVGCRERIRHVIATFKPDIVIHNATLKQIPICEKNPVHTVLTNVIGTQNIADACRDFKVKAMLYLSSHEASSSTNVLGATKHLAESYCLSLDALERKKPHGTRFVNVRLGNLLDASGSVVPLFKRQLERGGPLTVTHPEVMRYFMSSQQSVTLALQALALAMNTEKKEGQIFVLDQGQPIKIIDLASYMIQKAENGHKKDIKVNFIGLRPGEELIEKTSIDEHHPTESPHISLFISRIMDHGFLVRALHELEIVAKNQDKESTLRLLQALVPKYKKNCAKEEELLVASE